MLFDFLLAWWQSHPFILTYVLLINLVALFAYGSDKISARSGAWRVRERTLLLFAALGGSAGALFGMWLFRHKTRKNSFLGWIIIILLLQSVFLLYFTGVPNTLLSF